MFGLTFLRIRTTGPCGKLGSGIKPFLTAMFSSNMPMISLLSLSALSFISLGTPSSALFLRSSDGGGPFGGGGRSTLVADIAVGLTISD